jgi:hypothetical protein
MAGTDGCGFDGNEVSGLVIVRPHRLRHGAKLMGNIFCPVL